MNDIGLRGIGTALPERFVPLASLKLLSPAARLAEFGFDGAWVAEDPAPLALESARRALTDAALDPLDVDAFLHAGALPAAHLRRSECPSGGVLDAFCYSASWLQEELGLDNASVSGIAQQGCAGMFAALRTARALLAAEPDLDHVLCVGADTLPEGSCREILYNVISDGACAAVVSRERIRERWLGFDQISKGWYWDVPVRKDEIVAAYFPTAKRVLDRLLARCGCPPDEIDLVIPTGVNATSWPILLRLAGIPEDRLFNPPRAFGHTIAADPFLFLEQARSRLQPGMRVLMFTFGFGSSWCALLLEVTREDRP